MAPGREHKPEREVIEFYDLHSHFLPGMDDGAKDEEEALAMLAAMQAQGCRGIVSTSHYYARRESIEGFLERRQAALERLKAAAAERGAELPEIALGAEVAYYPGMAYDEELEKLCFGSSRFLLLEMPFSVWTPEVMRDIRQAAAAQNIKLIVAHLERFFKTGTKEQIEELVFSDALIQVNAENFASRSEARAVMKMIKSGWVQLICSDCHNTGARRPNMDLAIERLKRSGMQDELFGILSNNRAVFKEAAGEVNV